jgi:hypothetical protein
MEPVDPPYDPLYIDKKRLDFYFDEIFHGPDRENREKIPMWHGGISFAGLQLGGTQELVTHDYTVPEKISKLTKHGEDKGWVVHGRPDKHWYWLSKTDRKEFWLETCKASRVVIPTKQLESSPGALNLWISLARQATTQEHRGPSPLLGNLYLFENYPGNDKDKPSAQSAYSTLRFLLEDHDEQYKEAVIDPDFEHRLRNHKSFSVDPVVALRQLGATVAEPHDIRCLYRLRTAFLDSDSEPKEQRVSVFGYAVYIVSS